MVQDNPPSNLEELKQSDIYLKKLSGYHNHLQELHKAELQLSFLNAKGKGWDMRQWHAHCLSDLKLKRDQAVYLYQYTTGERDRAAGRVRGEGDPDG